jgi:hypothetical protein
MSVNTKQVTRRPGVRYESLDEMLAEAERLIANNPQTLGNWSPGQIYSHLAKTMNASIDGFDFSLSAPIRLILKLFMKRRFLTKSIPSGINGGNFSRPKEISDQEGLNQLRAAVRRQNAEPNRVEQPGLDQLSRDEWNGFHLRHAELHMSFLADPSLLLVKSRETDARLRSASIKTLR